MNHGLRKIARVLAGSVLESVKPKRERGTKVERKTVETRTKRREEAPERDRVPEAAEAGCVVIGGGPAGAMISLLLSRGGAEVTRLRSYGDVGQSLDREAMHPAVAELLGELGFAEHHAGLPYRDIPLALPTLLVVPAGHFARTGTGDPATPENPAGPPGEAGTATDGEAAPEPPAEASDGGEASEEESRYELGRAQGRIELLEQELRRREQEISYLRNR